MSRFLATLLVGLGCAAWADEPRKPHPFAPSLPELTEEEEKKIDDVIDRFIQYDIGKLKGAEGQQALREFVKLGPESIPSLIRGLNRAAEINNSCPVTVIAAKLNRFLAVSNDLKLLEYARDEIGAGVGPTVHRAVIQDLRFALSQRKNYLVRAGVTTTSPLAKPLRSMSNSALVEEAGREKGDRLRQIITELGTRNGDDVINTLGLQAASYTRETQQAARTALITVLTRLKLDELKKKLSDEKSEVRLAAVRVVRNREYRVGPEMIARLDDDDASVREWAQTALIRMAKGFDYGPPRNATKEQRKQAMDRWESWWARQK
jgi:hypothetical protein